MNALAGVGRATVLVGLVLAACAPNPTSVPITPTAKPQTTQPPTQVLVTPTLPPTQTALPTRQPHSGETPTDVRWIEFQNNGFKVMSTASVHGSDGSLYSAYLLTDSKLNSVMMRGGQVSASTETGPGVCQLVFYKWDGYRYQLLATEGEQDEPWWCEIIDWDAPEFLPDAQTRTALRLGGKWSDINGNGQPELAVIYNFCLWACHNAVQGVETRFFEIRNNSKVVDITADLPGVILPERLLHSTNPLTLFVSAPVDYGYSYEQVDLNLIFQWDGNGFIDVTDQYPDEYAKQVEKAVADIHSRYGRVLERFDVELLMTIPVMHNAAGLPRQDGLDIFLEVTDPTHWPSTDKATVCWLQVTRAYARIDYEQGVPFRINSFWAGFVTDEDELSEMTKGIDTSRFDVSACN